MLYEYNGIEFEVGYEFLGTETGFPFLSDGFDHNVFRITLVRKDDDKMFDFKFYDSHYNFMQGKMYMEDYELREAVDDFIRNLQLGMLDFPEFIDEMGSSGDCKDDYHKWKAIKEETERFIDTFGNILKEDGVL